MNTELLTGKEEYESGHKRYWEDTQQSIKFFFLKKVMTIVSALKRFFLWHYSFPQRYAIHEPRLKQETATGLKP